MEQIAAPKNIEDRLAAKIKDSDLGMFFEEEDLSDVIEKAIKKAFFEPRPDGRYDKKQSLIVEMAEQQFKSAIEKAAKPLAETIVQSEDFHDLLVKAVLAQITNVVPGIAYSMVSAGLHQSANNTYDELTQALTTKLQDIRSSGAMT